MKITLLVVPLAMAFVAAAGYAQRASCPYINVDTASGALQQTARLDVRQQTPAGDVCDFVAGEGKMERRLHVLVKDTTDAKRDYKEWRPMCTGEPQVVSALGNEAWRCQLSSASHGEIIFGRVRNTIFFVQISGIPDVAILQDKTSLTAEQVALNLY